MINPLGLIIGIILIFILRGKQLLWTGAAFLLWAVLAFVPDFFNVAEFSDTAKGLLIYFSMYGVFMGLPIGILCLIAGIIKRIKEKTSNQELERTVNPPAE